MFTINIYILLLLVLSIGAKVSVTCSGKDEGGWTAVNGGDHAARENKTGIQDNDNDIHSSSETANGTVCNSKEEAIQQVEN